MSNVWNDQGEQLPEEGVLVLALALPDDEDPFIAYHDGEGWFEVGGLPRGQLNMDLPQVTHWAKLPGMPKDLL